LKVISFTSVEQCEEKWAYVSSIAKIIAREGRKILVVDCNIDNFRIKKYFGMELEGILDELIQHNGKNIFEASGTPNLHFIPKGLGLSDLDGNLDFEKIVKLIEKAREEYDLILIDSPPAGIMTEGVRLSMVADGTVIIVLSDITKKQSAKRTKVILDSVNANLLGVILGV